MSPASSADGHEPDEVAYHRQSAVTANNEAWDLLDSDGLDADDLDELIERAYASSYHWRRATEPGAPERARAAWLLARVHTVAGNVDLALRHAGRCATLTAVASDACDFDRAYAHEAMARAHALAGHLQEAERERASAAAVPIADAEDRRILEDDLAAGPWFALD